MTNSRRSTEHYFDLPQLVHQEKRSRKKCTTIILKLKQNQNDCLTLCDGVMCLTVPGKRGRQQVQDTEGKEAVS